MSEKITLTKEGIRTTQSIISPIFGKRQEEVVVPYTGNPIIWHGISITVKKTKEGNKNGDIINIELVYDVEKIVYDGPYGKIYFVDGDYNGLSQVLAYFILDNKEKLQNYHNIGIKAIETLLKQSEVIATHYPCFFTIPQSHTTFHNKTQSSTKPMWKNQYSTALKILQRNKIVSIVKIGRRTQFIIFIESDTPFNKVILS